MANYRAVANGNWSALATWQDDSSGSYVASTVLPGAADVVYANNFTVTLDINVVVLELRTNATTNVTNGGVFNYGAANSVTANVYAGQSVNCLVASSGTKTFIGNSYGSNANNGFIYGALVCTGGVLNHIGSSFGGNGFFSLANSTSVGDLCTGGVLNQYGTATGGNGAINTQFHSAGSHNSGVGSILNLYGVAIGSNVNVSTTAGASNRSTGTMYVQSVQWGTGVGVTNLSTGQLNIQNVILNSDNAMPVSGNFRFTNNTTNSIVITKLNNSTKTLLEDNTTDIPVAANVRSGISYASGALTGTLVVPPANAVNTGVVYDNGTIGTGFTAEEFLNAISVSPNPLAERMRNMSTVQTTGDQIAAAL